jgi:GNAT superfamily N-acetyltransferase
VQRLAVHPAVQGRGIGAALLSDGLRWLRRWGARDALVNTQEGNHRSLRLYQRAGFVLQPDGLAVLQIALDERSGRPEIGVESRGVESRSVESRSVESRAEGRT